MQTFVKGSYARSKHKHILSDVRSLPQDAGFLTQRIETSHARSGHACIVIEIPPFLLPMLQGSVEGRTLASSYQKYRQDLWENCKALWMVWVPAQVGCAFLLFMHCLATFYHLMFPCS